MVRKLEDCLGKEVNVCVKKSTAYFSGRDCNLDNIVNKYDNFTLFLEGVSAEAISGKFTDGKKKDIPFLARNYQDTSSEAKDLIRRYKCVEEEIVSVKYKDEVIYKNG